MYSTIKWHLKSFKNWAVLSRDSFSSNYHQGYQTLEAIKEIIAILLKKPKTEYPMISKLRVEASLQIVVPVDFTKDQVTDLLERHLDYAAEAYDSITNLHHMVGGKGSKEELNSCLRCFKVEDIFSYLHNVQQQVEELLISWKKHTQITSKSKDCLHYLQSCVGVAGKGIAQTLRKYNFRDLFMEGNIWDNHPCACVPFIGAKNNLFIISL